MRTGVVNRRDLSAQLICSACQLRARDELLQQAIARVSKSGTVSAEDWQALAEGVEASLRVPASTLLMFGAFVEEQRDAEGTDPGLRGRVRALLRRLLD